MATTQAIQQPYDAQRLPGACQTLLWPLSSMYVNPVEIKANSHFLLAKNFLSCSARIHR